MDLIPTSVLGFPSMKRNIIYFNITPFLRRIPSMNCLYIFNRKFSVQYNMIDLFFIPNDGYCKFLVMCPSLVNKITPVVCLSKRPGNSLYGMHLQQASITVFDAFSSLFVEKITFWLI